MSPKKHTFLLAATLALAPLSVSAEGLMRMSRVTGAPCIPDTEFRFGPVTIDIPIERAIAKLGLPVGVGAGGQDDFIDETVSYDGLTLYGFQGNVAEAKISSASWRTPSGLTPGMSQDHLNALLGAAPPDPATNGRARYFDVYQCGGGQVIELMLFFRFELDRSNTVQTISILQDWP